MHELIIEAGHTERHYWRDLWRYRELFFFLAWRDILVRYKQTVVGIAWGVIRPVLMLVILTILFGRVAGLPSGGVPYPLMVFCGMLPWQFFASGLSESGNSLVSNARLISKVYFPRLVMPASSVITSMVDFCIGCVLLGILMVKYQIAPPLQVLCLPLFILLAFATAFGTGLWISALMVRYRDFKVLVPFVVQFGLYASPIGFTSSIITERFLPEQWRILYWLNPIVGVIDGFRWSLLGGDHVLYWPGLLLGCGVVAVTTVTGLWYFRRAERMFSDVI
jgi:lipopolysaccharide transport system permease protein